MGAAYFREPSTLDHVFSSVLIDIVIFKICFSQKLASAYYFYIFLNYFNLLILKINKKNII
jgi:hypothetical protein